MRRVVIEEMNESGDERENVQNESRTEWMGERMNE